MELICEKYREKEAAATARCRRPREYCKFRASCMIHFLARENSNQQENDRPDRPAHKENAPMLDFSKGDGLLPAIVQDHASNEVLMLAYINQEAWQQTLATGKAYYWSRSRHKLWLKGETSGHIQEIREILVDCDADTVVYRVEQLGGAACHTGHRSCFYRRVADNELEVIAVPVFDPAEVYRK